MLLNLQCAQMKVALTNLNFARRWWKSWNLIECLQLCRYPCGGYISRNWMQIGANEGIFALLSDFKCKWLRIFSKWTAKGVKDSLPPRPPMLWRFSLCVRVVFGFSVAFCRRSENAHEANELVKKFQRFLYHSALEKNYIASSGVHILHSYTT